MDYKDSTTLGLYSELEICDAYGNSVLSPPEKSTSHGHDQVKRRKELILEEIKRRNNGVLVGRVNDIENWEDIPKWHHTVNCVRYPLNGGGYELVAYSDSLIADKAATDFNTNATTDFLNRYGKATVVKKILW